MNRIYQKQFLIPVIIIFLIVNAFCLTSGKWLDGKNINHLVVMGGNLIVAALTLITSAMHVKSLQNQNPHAFVRSVTLASFIKLIVIAASVMVYGLNAENKSIFAIATVLLLYIIYTVIEVKGAMKINLQKNAKN